MAPAPRVQLSEFGENAGDDLCSISNGIYFSYKTKVGVSFALGHLLGSVLRIQGVRF